MKKSELRQLIREVINEMSDKMRDVDIVAGETIVSIDGKVKDESLRLHCHNGVYYDIDVSYDYGNDSHAFISEISMNSIIGSKIVEAYHEDKDSYGVTLVFVDNNNRKGTITIQHDHNGYYGFSYYVTKGQM